MMKYPTGIALNTKTGRFHPISFRLAPLPGGRSDSAFERYKSIGHHTEGFATREEALAWIAATPACKATGREYEWDGEDVPTTIDFFENEAGYGVPEPEHSVTVGKA